MAETDDLYALLELPRNAEPDAIRAAIRAQRRVWIRRQSSPDPERRTLAEQRIRDLDRAERTLLEPTARQAYDRMLETTASPATSTVGAPPASSGPTGPSGGVGPAGPSGRSTRTTGGAGGFVDRGNELLDAHRWREAITQFHQQLAIDPSDVGARRGIAEAYVGSDRLDEGVRLLRELATERPEDTETRKAYALALHDQAIEGLGEVDEGRLVLSGRQVALLRRNLRAIAKLGLADPQVQGLTSDLRDLAREATRRVRMPSENLRYYLVAFVVAVLVMAFVPVPAAQVLAALLAAGVVMVYYRRHYPPRWRVRRQQNAGAILRRGR